MELRLERVQNEIHLVEDEQAVAEKSESLRRDLCLRSQRRYFFGVEPARLRHALRAQLPRSQRGPERI